MFNTNIINSIKSENIRLESEIAGNASQEITELTSKMKLSQEKSMLVTKLPKPTRDCPCQEFQVFLETK